MSIDPIASRLALQGVAYAPEIAGAARRHAVDPELLAAVAAQETGGPGSNAGRNEVGDGGHGRGLFQIDDRWHDFAKTSAAMDPAENADYAAGMISGLLAHYDGNVHRALSAYNAGSPDATGTTTQWADGRRLGYADSVMEHYARLTGGDERALSPTAIGSALSPASTQAPAAESEMSELMAALQSQAASFPSLPAAAQPPPPQPYQQQAIDYGGLLADDSDN
ncbi:MAG: transglycosylase SLT domain-containing protein [Candidatus Eremiobacteraeota bacterium]|nr:transglycosylase SLT domain-containing protein [Candidatus Eremiobacteraeota bacterium]